MVAPAYADQVRPVAERKKNPAAAQTPTPPCSASVRRRPVVPRTLRRARRRENHSTSPPAEITHSQLAASSLYSRPPSPRCRSRWNLSIQVRRGSAPVEPYCSRAPRTSAVYGSTNTASVWSSSTPGTPDSSTLVVASASGEGRTAATVPWGWAARAAATCSLTGSFSRPAGTVSSWSYTIFSAWKEAAYSRPVTAATRRNGATSTPA